MKKRVKLTFEYDGTDFLGWQRQPEGRTVEGVIEEALSKLYQEDINLIGQGRTDSGVHAEEQVAHADLPVKYSMNRLYNAMAGLLPADVALINVDEVDESFHARFHAKERSYRYQVVTRPSPLIRKYSWYCKYEVSISELKQCAEFIKGEHDFVNFCIPHEGESTTVCYIKKSEWVIDGPLMIYKISGDRFLRHMVRRLVGTMVEAGRSKIKTEDFRSMLQGPPTDQKGHAAPSSGLILEKVYY